MHHPWRRRPRWAPSCWVPPTRASYRRWRASWHVNPAIRGTHRRTRSSSTSKHQPTVPSHWRPPMETMTIVERGHLTKLACAFQLFSSLSSRWTKYHGQTLVLLRPISVAQSSDVAGLPPINRCGLRKRKYPGKETIQERVSDDKEHKRSELVTVELFSSST